LALIWSGAVPPLPQYAFMVWYSVEKRTGTTLPYLYGDELSQNKTHHTPCVSSM
jgi:hypothetical protein